MRSSRKERKNKRGEKVIGDDGISSDEVEDGDEPAAYDKNYQPDGGINLIPKKK